MTDCTRCGVALADQAAYCPACGAPRGWQPAPPLMHRLADDTRTMEALVLAGAICAFVMAGFVLLFGIVIVASMAAFRNAFGANTGSDATFGPELMFVLLLVLGTLDLVWGFMALRARNRMHAGDALGGGKSAIIAGALMTFLGVGLLGLLVMVPGIIVYSRANQAAATMAPTPPRPR